MNDEGLADAAAANPFSFTHESPRNRSQHTVAGSDDSRPIPTSEAEAAQTRIIVRSPTERPVKRPILLADRQVVDGRMACRHQPLRVELPVLVTEGAKPVAGVIVPLVRESNGDTIVLECPQLLDQSIVQLAVPFATKKRDDLLTAGDEFRPIAPAALEAVGAGHLLGVARIPAIL